MRSGSGVMERRYQAAGVTEETIALARAAMAKQLRAELEDFVDEQLRRTLLLPGYERLDPARVRPNTKRSALAILESLDGGDAKLFGDMLYEVAYMRAKQGLPPSSLQELANITENSLNWLAERCLDGAVPLLSAAIVAREIADGARAVILGAFQKAHFEARDELERLASQFSAPVLPALPGVLVLPIVGAVSPARADQIVDALLAGITRYRAHTALLDLTGLTDVDATLPGHLERATSAARLVGARAVLVGIKPATARALVGADVGLAGVTTHATLAAALLSVSRANSS